ncbi:MAG: dihydrodipicolinate synthase family protein [Acidobacteria bacterium]|nr:dihydrodipicolinate synthase family protein [Acidobacteriota bacterium]
MNWKETLRRGVVIPAHPLALTAERKLDERRQRALTRYYLAAGAGGVAVGVHTTQFAIHDPKVGLYRPVLELARGEWLSRGALGIAGIVGGTGQAVAEAELAAGLGYHAGLVSLAALSGSSEDQLIAHVRQVSQAIPVFGFYLQPAVGGRVLSHAFWRRFLEIENVVAIKIAPFNRYQTLDVVRALALSGRQHEITLYTGNDDSIVLDLLTEFQVEGRSIRIPGGLLGHWSVWTASAVRLLSEIHQQVQAGTPIPARWLSLAQQVTDSNAAFFDSANAFHGCIAGLHEVLRRQGLLAGTWCWDPKEALSPGQAEEIDRVYRQYPELNDDAFVAQHRDEWLKA